MDLIGLIEVFLQEAKTGLSIEYLEISRLIQFTSLVPSVLGLYAPRIGMMPLAV